MRYSGQDHTLEVTLQRPLLDDSTIAKAVDAFVAQYYDLYGKIDDDNPVEVASLRVVLTERGPDLNLPAPTATRPSAPHSHRRMIVDGGAVDAPVFRRVALAIGQAIEGPALIEERESTTVLGRGDKLTVDASGALIIDVALPRRTDDAVPRKTEIAGA
jgi:N-methylhydantoinase A/oxoprolinase/acetone carboxylase beta subunit